MSPFFAISMGPVKWRSKTDKRAQARVNNYHLLSLLYSSSLCPAHFCSYTQWAESAESVPVLHADCGRNPTWQQSVRIDVPPGVEEALIEVSSHCHGSSRFQLVSLLKVQITPPCSMCCSQTRFLAPHLRLTPECLPKI